MGGHYGSIHVRTNDRDEVRIAVENLQDENTQRFYIAPPINDWVTIFPENNGQSESVTEALVEKLPNKTIIHCLVHDDDIFAYWLFENGQLSDSYNSCPEYLGDENPPPRGGNAAAFANLLAPQKIKKLQALLDEPRYTFELERQDKFAELLGLPNTAAAYEYIKSGDIDQLEQRSKFIHVPDLSVERNARRAEQAKDRKELKELLAKRILLIDQKAEKSANSAFYKAIVWEQNRIAPHVIVGSCDIFVRDASRPGWKQFTGPSWKESEIDFSFIPQLPNFRLSPAGDSIAVAQNSHVEIWDLQTKTLAAKREFNGIVGPVTFGVDDKWLFVTIRGNPKPELHRIALRSGLTDKMLADEISHFEHVTPHPDGQALAVIDNFGILVVIDIESMRIVTQRWICDRSSLLQHEVIKNVAEQMFTDILQLMPPEQVKLHRKESMRHFLPSERIRVGCFNADGSWLFCGAEQGLRGLPWKEVIEGADMTPIDATISIEAEPRHYKIKSDEPSERRIVYAVAFDPICQRVLYAGLEGKVSFYNLQDGRSGTLLTIPGEAHFSDFALSSDRSVLTATANRFDFKDLNKKFPQHFQIWNYRALCEAVGLDYE